MEDRPESPQGHPPLDFLHPPQAPHPGFPLADRPNPRRLLRPHRRKRLSGPAPGKRVAVPAGKERRQGRLWPTEKATEAEIDQWILSCADNYNTKLGNLEEGGIDLSGGQWQRLSIARMLYRKAGIYIWDEPTAAMDPLAESRLYTAFFQKRAKQNANIFVTHRLGAAVSADEICVLEKGRLVEQGTHKQLMENKDGLYYQMFCAQKGMYE